MDTAHSATLAELINTAHSVTLPMDSAHSTKSWTLLTPLVVDSAHLAILPIHGRGLGGSGLKLWDLTLRCLGAGEGRGTYGRAVGAWGSPHRSLLGYGALLFALSWGAGAPLNCHIPARQSNLRSEQSSELNALSCTLGLTSTLSLSPQQGMISTCSLWVWRGTSSSL